MPECFAERYQKETLKRDGAAQIIRAVDKRTGDDEALMKTLLLKGDYVVHIGANTDASANDVVMVAGEQR